MASSRIRYGKLDSENKMTSVKTFSHATNGARYKVVLNFTESQWLVIDDQTGLTAASNHQTSAHKMKLEAKKALEQLGITFEKETRGEESTGCPINEQAAADYQNDLASGNND